jgi:hypothetical protein
MLVSLFDFYYRTVAAVLFAIAAAHMKRVGTRPPFAGVSKSLFVGALALAQIPWVPFSLQVKVISWTKMVN